MVRGSNARGGHQVWGYGAAMACEFGLQNVMKMIERAALHLNFFWGGVCNSSNVLYPQCSILPRLVASRCHQNCSYPPILCTNFPSWPANGRRHALPRRMLGYLELALRLRFAQEATGAGHTSQCNGETIPGR